MKKFIALLVFGAVSFANAEGTTNPVIIEKLAKLVDKNNRMLEKE